MLNRMRFVLLMLLTVICTISVLAQDACPALVQSALEYVDRQCSGIVRNQACYGNLLVEAVPQVDATSFKFDAPGDIADIASILSLNLSGMSTPDEWGVMLMSVQGNLPDSTPGQNITLLLFGDITIDNLGGAVKPVLLDVTARQNTRVRSGPGTQNSQIGTLASGSAVQTDGRNADSTWLRVILEDSTAGWVSAELVQVSGDMSALAVVEGTEIAGTLYGPMQAFYFTSGLGNPQCDEAPPDGILIQTPSGVGEIELLVNEVQINVGSTIYMTAQPDGVMHLPVLDGQIRITAAGVTIVVPEGAAAVIPLDANGIASGPPTLEGYLDSQAAMLDGVIGVLPEDIDIAPGLTEDELSTPRSGQWEKVVTSIEGGCRVNEKVGDTSTLPITFNNTQMNFNGIDVRTSGNYTYDYQNLSDGTIKLVFTSAYSATETIVYNFTYTTTTTTAVPGSRQTTKTVTQTCTSTVVSQLTFLR